MPKINFKLSDDQKFQAIWALLNTEYNEEGNWTVTYGISAVYDDYALVKNYEDGEFYRAYYNKNDENDMVELGDVTKCYVIDVTESEMNTINTLRALNGGTYELVSEELTNAKENFEKVSEFSAKIEELTNSVSTLETERDNSVEQINEFTAQIETANNTINSLNEELASLKEYKLSVETREKEAVIDEYSEHLAEDILNGYRENIGNYTVEELDMRLAYELKKSNSSIFSNKPADEGIAPKDTQVDGLTAILSKYKK